jgi:AcrR family transcriptional regulator
MRASPKRRRSKAAKDTRPAPGQRTASGKADDKPNVRKDLVRDRLIDTAAEIFYAQGYKQSNINDIAAALQLSRSSVYHYFKNKKEILAALLEREVLIPYNANLQLMERKDLKPSERLREAVLYGIVRRLSGEPRFLVLGRLEADGMPDDLAAFYNGSKRQILEQYSKMISDCIAAGEFRKIDPQLAAFAIIGMANWTSWWYSPAGRMTPKEIGEAIVDIGILGLARRNAGDNSTDQVRVAVKQLRKQLENLERAAG